MILFSFLLFRKEALVISIEGLIDNSREESYGKILWSDIEGVSKFKKYSIEITIRDYKPYFSRLNFFQKILFYSNNWGLSNRVIVSSALMGVDRDSLYEELIRNI